ncbi:hypothetical protein C8Q78DRAFT_1081351 [Trametes maxima]|nr:hypothetical protein C8Q78DRAFT_1081351 [Trametes maxima]
MASLFDILGVVFGVVGLISAVPIVVQWMENRLPPAHLTRFDGIAAEAETLLEALEQEDGPLGEEQLRGFREQLSREISSLCEEAIQLRAKIAVAALADHEPDMFVPADAPLPAGTPAQGHHFTGSFTLRSVLRAKPSNSPPPPYSTAGSGHGEAASMDQLPPSGESASTQFQTLRRVRSLPALYAAMAWAPRSPPDVLGVEGGLRRRRRGKKVHFALPDIISNGNYTDDRDD